MIYPKKIKIRLHNIQATYLKKSIDNVFLGYGAPRETTHKENLVKMLHYPPTVANVSF